MSRTRVDFPEPDTPVTATKFPSGISTSTSCKLCSRAPMIRSECSPRHAAARAPESPDGPQGNHRSPMRKPFRHRAPALSTQFRHRARQPLADVNNPVAFANGLFVVFDNNHRVAQITQPSQRVDEPAVITLVQTDRRLVEHVQGAHQTRTNLACKPNALRLSSRQRSCRSSQREVIEADIEQKTESSIDLFCPRSAIMRSRSDSSRPARNSAESAIDISQTCEIFRSLIVTASVNGFSRAPSQAEHLHLTHVPLKLLTSPVTICRFVAPFNPRNTP